MTEELDRMTAHLEAVIQNAVAARSLQTYYNETAESMARLL